MPTIDLTEDEHAAVTAAIRRAVEEDRFPARRVSTPALGAGEARSGGGGAEFRSPPCLPTYRDCVTASEKTRVFTRLFSLTVNMKAPLR
jgi:hypothetical protein